jgi:hypothetical protein
MASTSTSEGLAISYRSSLASSRRSMFCSPGASPVTSARKEDETEPTKGLARQRAPKWLADHIKLFGIRHIKDSFRSVDVNGDNELQREEFYQFIRVYGSHSSSINLTESVLRAMFNDVTKARTCPASLESIVAWLSDVHATELSQAEPEQVELTNAQKARKERAAKMVAKQRTGLFLNRPARPAFGITIV